MTSSTLSSLSDGQDSEDVVELGATGAVTL